MSTLEELFLREELLLEELSYWENEWVHWNETLEYNVSYTYQDDNGSWVADDEDYEDDVLFHLSECEDMIKDIEESIDDVHAQIDLINSRTSTGA